MPAIVIHLTIPADKEADFLEGFLRDKPIPVDENGNPTMSASDWVSQVTLKDVNNIYVRGKNTLAKEATVPVIDDDIIS